MIESLIASRRRCWRWSWLLPIALASCLMNPQGEDPSASDNASVGGTGGTGSTASTGGDTATPGAAGSPPLTGSGGSAGAYDEGACTAGGAAPEPNPALLPESGFILDADGSGIIGPWFTFVGAAGSEVTPPEGATVPATAGAICVSGTAAQDLDWAGAPVGAGVGFHVCQIPDDPSDLPPPLNAFEPGSRHSAGECDIAIHGIAFEITGTIPAGLRLEFHETGRAESTTATISGAGAVCAEASAATVPLDPVAPPLEASNIESLLVVVPQSADGPVSFDFCIRNLSVW